MYSGIKAQDADSEFPELKGPYLGQIVPGIKPELFAEGIVSTPMGMHGNIVFSPDFKEAFWHPDEPRGLYYSEIKDGCWTQPHEISFVQNYMHDAPCYSHDGRKRIELYPESANVYDSLGEAYRLQGNDKQAIQNYDKSLPLNPDNTNAKEMLKKLMDKK